MIARAIQAFRLPSPDASVTHWHISPGIDTTAYAFSWLWLLLPFAFFGPSHPTDYMTYWIVGNVLTVAHRHITMPYVYMDGQVYASQRARFTVVPALLFTGFLASGLFRGWRIPVGFFTTTDVAVAAAAVLLLVQWWRSDRLGADPGPLVRWWLTLLPLAWISWVWMNPVGPQHHTLAIGTGLLLLASSLGLWRKAECDCLFARSAPAWVGLFVAIAAWASAGPSVGLAPRQPLRVVFITGGVAAFAGAWNIWHVYMQKYGILRMYAAKSGLPEQQRVPGWVDRLLVFGWVPAYLFYLPAVARPLLAELAPTVLPALAPAIDRLEALAAVGLPVSVALGLASVGVFFWWEHRASGLRNPARVVMGVGTTLLGLTFFVWSPLEVYVAYGFSHAVEYMVFVWAFQRRRYREPLAHKPLLQRLLRSPLSFYIVFFALVGGVFAGVQYGGGTLYQDPWKVLGAPVRSWVFYWTVWQSMAHFYFDSFLWKMRLPEVRASL